MPSGLRDRRSFPRDMVDTPANPKGQNGVKEKNKAKPTGPMDKWVEPTIATKPSYADHHGAPLGVLEHMQPLGEAPSSKVRTRVKADAARKSAIGRSSAAVGLDAQETPEGTPQPSSVSQIVPEAPPAPVAAKDDDKDDDYAPRGNGKKRERTSRARKQSRESEAAALPPPASSSKEVTKTNTATATATTTPKNSKPTPKPLIYTGEKLACVVDDAKRRAIESGKPELAAAVNEIYLESFTDQRLRELMERILTQTAGPAEMSEFQNYVKQAKKRLRLWGSESPWRKAPESPPTTITEANGSHAPQQHANSKLTSDGPATQNPSSSTSQPDNKQSEKPRQRISIKVKSPPKSESRRTTQTPRKKPASQQKKETKSNMKPPSKTNDGDSDLSELTDFEETDAAGQDHVTEQQAANDNLLSDVNSRAPSTSRQTTEQPRASRESSGAPVREREAARKAKETTRNSLTVPKANLKRSSVEAELEDEQHDRDFTNKKQKFTDGMTREFEYEQSSERDKPYPPGRMLRGSKKLDFLNTPTLPVPASGNNDISDLDSPLSSPASSHQSLPPDFQPKVTGKRAKTKQSPEKKHSQNYGGLAAVGGGAGARDSPIGEDDDEELSDNQDYCSACQGSGFLLCCDGCDRSFHFTCLDPPLSENASELNEPWYCFICVAKRPSTAEQPERSPFSLFAPLFNKLSTRNPRTFTLPQEIREFFEGVGTGKNGDFVETTSRMRRKANSLPDRPDDYKLKDSKGNAVLCYHCNKGSGGTRAILQCDDCGTSWHLDCLDPPLALPPGRTPEGYKVSDWMCPLHSEHDLRRIEVDRLYGSRSKRKMHVRKPRQARRVDTFLRRGAQNDGLIEVVEDESDDSDGEFYLEGDPHDESIVYKMPASGIKLDFIEKAKQHRIQSIRDMQAGERLYLANEARSRSQKPRSQLVQSNFNRRSLLEQQLALSLTQFASNTTNQDLDLGFSKVESLVAALITEAPDNLVNPVVAAEHPATTAHAELSEQQISELKMLQELINRRLEAATATAE